MPLFWVVLKYWTYALVACWAAVKRPGTGPLMSEELPMVMVLSVIPGWFLNPAQEPAFTPATEAPPPFGVPAAEPPVAVEPEPAAAPVPPAAAGEPPDGASTAVLPVSPVPASDAVPVVSAPLPEPRLPETARLAARTSLGLSSEPPHAVGTSSASARTHAPTNLLRTAELLTPVSEPRTGPTSHNGRMWRRLHRKLEQVLEKLCRSCSHAVSTVDRRSACRGPRPVQRRPAASARCLATKRVAIRWVKPGASRPIRQATRAWRGATTIALPAATASSTWAARSSGSSGRLIPCPFR